VRQEA
jgi:hypothetical protein